jgi:hypothetical protein
MALKMMNTAAQSADADLLQIAEQYSVHKFSVNTVQPSYPDLVVPIAMIHAMESLALK